MEDKNVLKGDFEKFGLDPSVLDVEVKEEVESDMPDYKSVDEMVGMLSESLPGLTDNEFAELIIGIASAYKGIGLVEEVEIEATIEE